MVLLWGLPGDTPFDAVWAELDRQGVDYRILNQRKVLEHRLDLKFGAEMEGVLWSGEECILLSEVSAVYARVYEARKLSSVAAAAEQRQLEIVELEGALWTWMDITSARVLNRPAAMASNQSKPYQAFLIEKEGFSVPKTLITTDPDQAQAFWSHHGEVIYKSISGVRSIVSRLKQGDEDRLQNISCCPTQFQAFVPGTDYRVHVVGEKTFASKVEADVDDYRYAKQQGQSAELSAVELPTDIEARCIALSKTLDLPVAGVDLRLTPEGEWYCFEVNPSPCFTYYEHHTGQPIATAITEYLAC